MNIRTVLALLVLAVSGTGLVACGGGSASSGGSSGSDGSNLVVKVSDANTAYLHRSHEQGNRFAALISNFLISEAKALAAGGHTVTVWDSTGTTLIATGTTDDSGEVGFIVDPGASYSVCFDEVSCFPTPTVGTGEVIVVNATQDPITLDWVLLQEGVTTEPAADNLALFEDPNHVGKIIICHNHDKNNPHEISVSPSALQAHLNHGDELGDCPDPQVTTVSGTEETDDGKGNNGNNGNNGNKGNNGKKEDT